MTFNASTAVSLPRPTYVFDLDESTMSNNTDHTLLATSTVTGKTGTGTLTCYIKFYKVNAREVANFSKEASNPHFRWSYEWNRFGNIDGVFVENGADDYWVSNNGKLSQNMNFLGAFVSPPTSTTRSSNGLYTAFFNASFPANNDSGNMCLSPDFVRPGYTSGEAGNTQDRYVIASYRVQKAGFYAVSNGSVKLFASGGDGLRVQLFYEKADANSILRWKKVTTGVQDVPNTATTTPQAFGGTANWNITESLNVGDTISIAICGRQSTNSGAATSTADDFKLDFSVMFKNASVVY
jgi:hypothetical protein